MQLQKAQAKDGAKPIFGKVAFNLKLLYISYIQKLKYSQRKLI